MINYTSDFKMFIDKWNKENGDKTHRVNYSLNENSVVLDVGGYKGEWSQDIFEKYNCFIYIFEPVEIFYKYIEEKFKLNNKIKVFNYGLGGFTRKTAITINEDSSSVFNVYGSKQEQILIKNIVEVLEDLNLTNIDLCKLNLEGGEYEVVNALCKFKKIINFKNLQIQFHNITEIENCEESRNIVVKKILETHDVSYSYPWVWEGFSLKLN